jgi:hypothetical protein
MFSEVEVRYRWLEIAGQIIRHWRSYSPFETRFSTVKPAFLASEIDTGLLIEGVLNPEISFLTGLRQAGH